MSIEAEAVTDPGGVIEECAGHYTPLLLACRKKLLQDIRNAPAADELTACFERGKFMRPLLVFLCAAASGGNPSEALSAAVALELLHGASLIHDDIVDQAEERRGLRALHCEIGLARALIVGDFLILRAIDILARQARAAHSPTVLKAVRLLSRHAQHCGRGQIEELTPRGTCTEEQYLAIARGKTASQFVAAASMGAIFASASAADTRVLRTYAANVGIAFQLRDDELDLNGDAVLLGKPTGNSIQAGRPLLPIIDLEEHGSAAAIAAYRALVATSLPRRHELLALLEAEGCMGRLRQQERKYLLRALDALTLLRPSPECEALAAIAHYAVSRDC